MAGRYFARSVTAPVHWEELPLPAPPYEIILFTGDTDVEVQIKDRRGSWGDTIYPYVGGPLHLWIPATALRYRSASGTSVLQVIAIY